jgi:phosphopantetheinyl transferase
MFRYRLVTASEYPLLAKGHAWPGLLSPREEEILAAMPVLPRRRKWLMGRKAAKLLVREDFGLADLAEDSISVLNQPSGEPFVLIEGRGGWDHPISLSHRSEIGMAAAPIDASHRIGADLETVEPRDPSLTRQFFTDTEAHLVDACGDDADRRDELVARIWSAKEAVLKLVGLGLRIDTRGVVVSPLGGEPVTELPGGWRTVGVDVLAKLPRVDLLRDLRVIWRREGAIVLTVAVAGPG